MAFDAFLKIEGIDGESQDQFHKGEIDILSFSWGVTNPTAINPATGGASGRHGSEHATFHITKSVDKSSPLLFKLACAGTHIKQATLTCRKAGGTQINSVDVAPGAAVEFLKIKLTDVLISSVMEGGITGSDNLPMDQVSLNFLKYEIQEVAGDGSVTEASCSVQNP